MDHDLLRRVASGVVLWAAWLVMVGLYATLSQALAVMALAGLLAGCLLRQWRELWVVPAAVATVMPVGIAWSRRPGQPNDDLPWLVAWIYSVLTFIPPALLGTAIALLVVRRLRRVEDD